MTIDSPGPLPADTPPAEVARFILANMPVTDPHGWLAALAHACQRAQTWEPRGYFFAGRPDDRRDYSRCRG